MGVDWTKGSQWRSKLEGKLPVKNQGSNFSCGGQAGSMFLQIQAIIRGEDGSEISAKSIYAPIAYPGGGTTISRLEQQIGTVGANLEKAVPSYDVYGNPLSEAMMIERSWQTPQTELDALLRSGYTPVDITDDIEAVAEAINAYGAVIWKIGGQNGHTPDWRSPTPQPPSKDNKNTIWWHFMCAYDFGVVNGEKVIYAKQSMGTTWGDNGTQYFNEPYFDSGYIDAFTLIYDKNIVPDSTNHSIWAEIARWFRSFLDLSSQAASAVMRKRHK